MCVRHFRFCRNCNTYFTLNRGCVDPGKRPVLLIDALCANPKCKRRLEFWLKDEGTGRCSGENCTTETCRVETVYLTCYKDKTNNWKYILRPCILLFSRNVIFVRNAQHAWAVSVCGYLKNNRLGLVYFGISQNWLSKLRQCRNLDKIMRWIPLHATCWNQDLILKSIRWVLRIKKRFVN